jgi:glycosyltransferase involved in cell wall biosynthesis
MRAILVERNYRPGCSEDHSCYYTEGIAASLHGLGFDVAILHRRCFPRGQSEFLTRRSRWALEISVIGQAIRHPRALIIYVSANHEYRMLPVVGLLANLGFGHHVAILHAPREVYEEFGKLVKSVKGRAKRLILRLLVLRNRVVIGSPDDSVGERMCRRLGTRVRFIHLPDYLPRTAPWRIPLVPLPTDELRPSILLYGKINATKHALFCLRVVSQVRNTYGLAARLVIAGTWNPAYKEVLYTRDEFESAKACGWVQVFDHLVSDEELVRLIDDSWLCWFYRPRQAHFSSGILRSLARGRPVVVSNVGWQGRLALSHPECVLVVSSYDVNRLAAIIAGYLGGTARSPQDVVLSAARLARTILYRNTPAQLVALAQGVRPPARLARCAAKCMAQKHFEGSLDRSG